MIPTPSRLACLRGALVASLLAVCSSCTRAAAVPIVLGPEASLLPSIPAAGKNLGGAVVLVTDGGKPDDAALTRWLNDRGLVVFALRSRTPADVARAVRTLRERAAEVAISPQRIAVLGVDGGATVAGEAVFNAAANAPAEERPNFVGLVGGAMVPAGAVPNIPTFLAGAANDGGGKSATLDLWNKLRSARVPVDVHAYAQGDAPDAWPEQFFAWARFQGLLTDAPRVPLKGMVYLDGRVLPHGYVILTPVGFAGTGPIVARVINSTAGEAIGSFSVRADQGPIAGRYRVDVRQNMNRWLSNSFSGALVGGRGGNPTPEQAYFGHHRVLAPSIDDQKSFTKVRPTDPDDYVIEIKADAAANQELKLEVFSGAPLKPGPAAKPEENIGGLMGGAKNPGQAAYVEQILATGPGPGPGIPEPVLLWPNGAPEAVPDETGAFTDEDKPALYCFPASGATNTRAAFLVIPGGAFTNRCMDNEGVQVAKFLNRNGVGGFVLRYRIGANYPRRTISTEDGQRAMRFLRAHAADFGLDPNRIGIIGFSAGAELEGDAFFNAPTDGDPAAADPIDRLSAKANFSALIYGGRNLAKPAEAPPTFLFNTIEDGGHLFVEAAVLNALRQAGVPVEAHFYQAGPHGTSMSPGDPQLGQWPALMIRWMKQGGWIK